LLEGDEITVHRAQHAAPCCAHHPAGHRIVYKDATNTVFITDKAAEKPPTVS
jgi:hypothetical protein